MQQYEQTCSVAIMDISLWSSLLFKTGGGTGIQSSDTRNGKAAVVSRALAHFPRAVDKY